MGCLPQSGGCERPLTDAFVRHLNQAEGSHYAHQACLDVMDSTCAQPEALYADAAGNLRLVIERKSIAWPADYSYRHSNDHLAFKVFSEALRDFTFEDVYEIRLPLLIKGKQEELRAFALAAAKEVRAHWAQIEAGSGIRRRDSADWWWVFRRVPDWEKEEGSPSRGLRVTWVGRSMFDFTLLDPANPPAALRESLGKIYSGCVKKFSAYVDARRALVLDPHGDLRYEPTEWWQKLWITCPPPTQIQEIWSGIFDYVDEESQDWQFQRLL